MALISYKAFFCCFVFTPTEIFATARPGSNETVCQAARRPQLYQGPTRGPTTV